MKASMYLSVRIWLIVVLAGLLSTACQNEEAKVTPVETSSVKSADASCFIVLYYHTITPNYRNLWVGTNYCQYAPGFICVKTYRVIRHICWLNFDYLKDVCLSCPYDIYKRLPWEVFPDFRQGLEVNPAVRWSDQAAYFPISRGVIGIQFYAESSVINKQSFTLRSDLVLSAEMQKELGVVGQKIPAGTYPVSFNEKSKTYNAIVAVR